MIQSHTGTALFCFLSIIGTNSWNKMKNSNYQVVRTFSKIVCIVEAEARSIHNGKHIIWLDGAKYRLASLVLTIEWNKKTKNTKLSQQFQNRRSRDNIDYRGNHLIWIDCAKISTKIFSFSICKLRFSYEYISYQSISPLDKGAALTDCWHHISYSERTLCVLN